MPATRSPKQRKISNSFQTVKNARTSSGKKAATKVVSKKNHQPSPVTHSISDGTSSSGEESEYTPLPPGSKLDVKRYDKYHKSIKPRFGMGQSPIHIEGENRVHEILRMFDLSYEYGPCVGVTRLERWERAQSLGLNPPPEVKEILQTQEGQTDEKYSRDVFCHEGI
ncbi:DNA polymerase delta, subunit 4-domain-containing protein [Cantharellus anzutake]|uniref:DNA polymerase delta, subunit 4-domain-containing protein n=1 Tax=Cantharellus anzutake TaxID=1750568 RepID=UPI0019058BAA|nr:DNA polymerase delta, subunit 4-domain-containing protein [Cantharellus anzutake]KAF8342627.1 DNA polymerase delta, subunit 4-domain-containing protein [Cantharellus anzutake]